MSRRKNVAPRAGYRVVKTASLISNSFSRLAEQCPAGTTVERT
jgi:hypothetical protein